MSPENRGVFQLLKEVTFRRILAFYSSQKWGHFGGICVRLKVLWLAGGTGLKASNRTVVFTINRAKFDCGDIGAHHATLLVGGFSLTGR